MQSADIARPRARRGLKDKWSGQENIADGAMYLFIKRLEMVEMGFGGGMRDGYSFSEEFWFFL